MTTKKGTILSSISSILNSDADKNYVLIKNIFQKPIEENFFVISGVIEILLSIERSSLTDPMIVIISV